MPSMDVLAPRAKRLPAQGTRKVADWVATHHLPALLLLAFFAMGMAQVVRASITFDEGPHLAIGYTTLRTRDFRLQPVHIHPPLANMLAAAPLLLQNDLPDPAAVPGWQISSLSAITDAVVWSYAAPRRIATAGRVPILLLGVLTGAVIYRWAKDLGRWGGALLALTLYVLDPNDLAHAALITTDAPAVFFSVATLYATHRFLRARPGDRHRVTNLVATALLLGLAQLTKVSALMLVPVVGLLVVVGAWTEGYRTGHLLRAAGARLAVVCGIAGLVVWAGYGFEVSSAGGLPFRVPAATHVAIFRSLGQHYELGHPTFALGRVRSEGWAWYFPLAFIVKTPLPVLLLSAAAVAIGIDTGTRTAEATTTNRSRGQGLVCSNGFSRSGTGGPALISALSAGLFPLLYAATSLFSTVNIGYRHLLPLLPFMFIAVGAAAGRLHLSGDSLRSLGWMALFGLLAWEAYGTIRTLPYPLTFFNELAGGPKNGYRYLVDSNLDWGQNLWDLKAWMVAHGEPHVAYAHYSPARPDTYGIEAGYLPPDPRAEGFTPWHPTAGLYAIGATVLQGPYAPDLNTYAWFRDREPLARLGNALFVYRVPLTAAPEWALLCSSAVDAAGLKRRLGKDDVRILQPMCDETLVFPATTSPGLSVLPPESGFPVEGTDVVSLRSAEGETTAVVRSVSGLSVHPEVPAPEGARLDGPIAFRGHTLGERGRVPDGAVRAWTYWRIDEIPARPLSLMAHLVAEDGATVAVGDGMGFPIDQWRVGDVIVQKHEWTIPVDTLPGSYEIRVGAYWLDTMERIRLTDGKDSMLIAVIQNLSSDGK